MIESSTGHDCIPLKNKGGNRGGMLEITSGIFRLEIPIPNNPLGHLNCYLVEGRSGWLMIDTGWNSPDAFRSLEAGLKDIGLKATDLRSIVITHTHIDHAGLAGRIKEASPGTEIMVHHWEAQWMDPRYVNHANHLGEMSSFLERHGVPSLDLSRMESATMPILQLMATAVPDRTLYGGEIVTTGGYDLEIIWTPGHSPGHVCLYEPTNRLLFSGDHVLPTISPNVGYHIQSSDNPLGDFLYSIQKLRHLPVDKVLPGHEGIFTDLNCRLDQLVEHHTLRKLEMQRAITEGHADAYTISANIQWGLGGLPWDRFPLLHKRAALIETIAHLECLRVEGKISRVIRNGMFFYEGP